MHVIYPSFDSFTSRMALVDGETWQAATTDNEEQSGIDPSKGRPTFSSRFVGSDLGVRW